MIRNISGALFSFGVVLLVFITGAATIGQAQPPSPTPELAGILNCEGMKAPNGYPRGWGGSTGTTAFIDTETVHGGSQAIRVERGPDNVGQFSMVMTGVAHDFSGSVITVRGFLKMDDVEGAAGFFVRQFDSVGTVGFASMQTRKIDGTRDWAEFSLDAPVSPESSSVQFGLLFIGTGTVWIDDLRVLVDGKPIWDAPKREPTVFDRDHEFDRGSGISLSELNDVQIDNLVLLGKVWGFEQYHHPAVAGGKFHFDYELFRVMPSVLEAKTREAGRAAIADWVAGLGDPGEAGTPAVEESPGEQHLEVPSGWVRDEALLGRSRAGGLRKRIETVSKGMYSFMSGRAPIATPSFEMSAFTATCPCPMPAISCWDCFVSGTLSSIGRHIGT